MEGGTTVYLQAAESIELQGESRVSQHSTGCTCHIRSAEMAFWIVGCCLCPPV